jgi:exodeoxyribonuclease V alpha subunit
MVRLAGQNLPELSLAAGLVSGQTRAGHICLNLSSLEGMELLEAKDGQPPIVCPRLGEWHRVLGECSVVGRPGQYTPLILDDHGRLYLYRYWEYQEKLADFIRTRLEEESNIDIAAVKNELERVFPGGNGDDTDWQRVAAFSALTHGFCVICGGPGTGKTTTVAKILALLVERTHPEKLCIALAAPTGKAAVRLQEAIERVKGDIDCPDPVKAAMPREASTIHRLLGSIVGSPYFRHNAKNPLSHDVVVVDEASMADLALMSKLVQSLSQKAKLILVGDKDQLASVEAGAVLGDICDTGKVHHFSERFCEDLKKATGCEIGLKSKGGERSGIQDCIIELKKSYRFGEESGIGALSRAVNAGDSDRAADLLVGGKGREIEWKDLPAPGNLARTIRDSVVQDLQVYSKISDPGEAFQRFARFRILCAVREGHYGVARLNSLLEQILRSKDLIPAGGVWYAGRPILVTRNDYELGLYNGDVGVILPDPEVNGELRAFFPAPEDGLRRFHPRRLPEHETAFAITVHKSQGSEFDRVLLILPDRDTPVLTRELLYTAVTRARRHVEVWSTETVFRTAVSRHVERYSGLRAALWAT